METNLKFNSQVCTTKIQSERLLALGLNPDTADMGLVGDIPIILNTICKSADPIFETPAWSLHRLIEMAQLPQSWQCLSGDWYNEIIAHIQSMIHINQFNKDYLEE